MIELEKREDGSPQMKITGPSRSECVVCGAIGILTKPEGEGHALLWTRAGSVDPFAREPWPHTSKSPYCPECWAKIKERQ